MIVAVYGTLRNGGSNFRLLKNSKFITNLKLKGFDLFDLGYFPGAKLGSKSILVELYEIDQQTLKNLDYLEGYRGPNNSNHYNRISITSQGYTFYIYTYCLKTNNNQLIESGDWFDRVNEKRINSKQIFV